MDTTQSEKIVVVGYGWIGQANALALVKSGYAVYYFDVAKNITFHYDDSEGDVYSQVVRLDALDQVDGVNTWYIVCVGDRVSDDGVQDISYIESALETLRVLKGRVVLRSTVLPHSLQKLSFDLYVPEFLHEKDAVRECLNPYFFVIGHRSFELELPSFLRDWERRARKTFHGTPEEASYIKYLSNLWNSVRIAFVNEFGDAIAEPKTPEDVQQIERVLDFVLERKSYLRYGQAFDGHCLPKDTRAFTRAHRERGKNVALLEGTYVSNAAHSVIQERHASLPKVYSFWNYRASSKGFVEYAWIVINSFPIVRTVRKRLKFIPDTISKRYPTPTFEKTRAEWERRARELPLYYSNTRTPSNKEVRKEEFIETGKEDYEFFIKGDIRLQQKLKERSAKKILDFGSGAGRLTYFMAEDFEEVYALDISPSMLARAQELVARKNVQFSELSSTAFPYEDDMFDFVFSYRVLHHVPAEVELLEYLRECARVLRSGGVAKLQIRTGTEPRKWNWWYGISLTPERAHFLSEQVGFMVLEHIIEDEKTMWVLLEKAK